MAVSVTIKTPKQAADTLKYVWLGRKKERQALLRFIIEGKDATSVAAVLRHMGPGLALRAVREHLARFKLDDISVGLEELPCTPKYRKPRWLLVQKLLRRPVRVWLCDTVAVRWSAERLMQREMSAMAHSVLSTRSPEFAKYLLGSSLTFETDELEKLKRLAAKYRPPCTPSTLRETGGLRLATRH